MGACVDNSPDNDPSDLRANIFVLADTASPAALTAAGNFLDNRRMRNSHLKTFVTRCLRAALSACMENRTLLAAERDELHSAGTSLQRSGAPRPSLVGIHSVLLLGHTEAIRIAQQKFTTLDLAHRLEEGGKRLLEISDEVSHCVTEGHAAKRSDGSSKKRLDSVEALRLLITEPAGTWRRKYLESIILEDRVSAVFPAAMAVIVGTIEQQNQQSEDRTAKRTPKGLVTIPVAQPKPHTLVLSPGNESAHLVSWLKKTVSTTAVYTRPTGLDEARARYDVLREVLPLGQSLAGKQRVIDVGRLLRYRMLTDQPTEYLNHYVDEIIGPILRLPDGKQAPLLETLRFLDKHEGSVPEAAAEMHVHQKTVRYRVDRIKELTGLNPMSRNCWAYLHLAIQLCIDFPDISAPWPGM